MKTLKLNQLNKQKVVENEMNAIKGGAMPVTPKPQLGPIIGYDPCEIRCVEGPSPSLREGYSAAIGAFN